MNDPFIVKYQPQNLEDFKLNNNLRQYIKTCLKSDNLLLLLVGDPGSGKTTLLNIIINSYFLDKDMTTSQKNTHVLYINSLREQGIQFYRNDVKTFCQTKSTIPGRKKIVILDDIDFINEQSQQVFRNCIDKYSDNVHFLISCINTQKVIESLQSRTTLIKLNLLLNEELYDIMQTIIHNENIIIDKQSKDFLLKLSNKSIRQLINSLEKIKILNKPINYELMVQICGNMNYNYFEEYILLCKNKSNMHKAIKLIFSFSNKGYSVMDILDSLTLYVKSSQILTETQRYNILPIICKYISIFHELHEDTTELLLLTRDVIITLTEDRNLLIDF